MSLTLVYDAQIDLLGHAHVEATVAGFHVENGIWRRLAGMTARQLLVSPNTSTASGFSFSRTVSTRAMVLPIVSAGVAPAALGKCLGCGTPSSLMEIPFSS